MLYSVLMQEHYTYLVTMKMSFPKRLMICLHMLEKLGVQTNGNYRVADEFQSHKAGCNNLFNTLIGG